MVTRARLALLRSLSRGREREERGLLLAEGFRLVREALLCGAPVEEILLTPAFAGTEAGAEIAARAAEAGLPLGKLSASELTRLADTRTPQGVIAVLRSDPADPSVLSREGLFVALDGVSDPGNVGTILRAADAFAARAVLGGAGTADFTGPKVVRAAMGATFHLPLLACPDLAGALAGERARGAKVAAATLSGADPAELDLDADRVFLVLGHETRGVSPEVLAVADAEVTIPCPGRAESLNVAMAGAILLSRLAGGRSR